MRTSPFQNISRKIVQQRLTEGTSSVQINPMESVFTLTGRSSVASMMFALSNARRSRGGQKTSGVNDRGSKVKASCPGLTAEDAILIRGEEIQIHVNADRQSTQGFRVWENN
jgi:hypothetical protein